MVVKSALTTCSMACWAAAVPSACCCMLPAMCKLVLPERTADKTSSVSTTISISAKKRTAPRCLCFKVMVSFLSSRAGVDNAHQLTVGMALVIVVERADRAGSAQTVGLVVLIGGGKVIIARQQIDPDRHDVLPIGCRRGGGVSVRRPIAVIVDAVVEFHVFNPLYQGDDGFGAVR